MIFACKDNEKWETIQVHNGSFLIFFFIMNLYLIQIGVKYKKTEPQTGFIFLFGVLK